MEEKTPEEKTSTFAERLEKKLAGSSEPVHADEGNSELIESQLDAVSGGAHGSVHGSISNENAGTES